MAKGFKTFDEQSAAAVKGFFPRKPLHWIGVILTSAAVAAFGFFALLLSGLLDLRASPPHISGLGQLLHFTLSRSVAWNAGSAPEAAQLVDDEALVQMAAGHYANACSNCHGAPGLGQNPVALSMRPEPPKLDAVNDRYSAEELYYILEHGIAFSAMPAWPVLNRPQEVWAMVRFVQALPDMSFDTYVELAYNRSAVEAGGDIAQDTLGDLPMIAFGADPERFSVGEPEFDGEMTRPYLPGDIQSAINVDGAAARPAIGFVPSGLDGGALQVCVQCHGAQGEGRPDGAIPNLTLQGEQYLYNALASYAHGLRQSGIMWPVAAQLSEPQMREIARFIGEGDVVPSPRDGDFDADLVAQGRQIAEDGVPLEDGETPSAAALPEGTSAQFDMQVYACRGCHGAEGASENLFPSLDGQHANYIKLQLKAFSGGGRGANNSYDPTGVLSHANLTDGQIEAVAAYFASQQPRAKGRPIQSLEDQASTQDTADR